MIKKHLHSFHLSKSLFLCFLVSSLLIAKFTPAFADTSSNTDTLRVYNLGEVVVTAQKGATVASSALREFNFERIRKQGVLNVAQAVELTLGSYVSIGSKNDMQIQLRGIDQRQLSVMLDGVPIYAPYDGLVDLGQIPVDVIEKITVTPGNSSVLYGPNSLGGSINILTSIPAKRNSRLRLFWGSGEMKEYSFQQSFIYKKFGFLLSAGHQRQNYFPLSEDFNPTAIENGDKRENSYFKKTDYFAKITFQPNPAHQTALSFSLIDNEKGVPPDIFGPKPRYWKFPTWRKWVLNLSSIQKIEESTLLKTVLFYDKYDNVLDSYDDATYTTQKSKRAYHSTYNDYSLGSNIFLTNRLSELNELTFGVNYKKDVHKEQPNRGSNWETYKMDTYTMGAEYELKTEGRFSFSSGLNLNIVHPVYAYKQPLRNDINSLDGRLGVSHSFSTEFEIFGSAGHRTRFPTLKELYSGYSGRNIPNPNLKEETAFNFELGTRFSFATWGKSELVFFDNEVTNMIVNKLVTPDTSQMNNVGKARLSGAELSTTLKPVENSTVSVGYSYLKAEDFSKDRVSDKLEYRPEHKLRLQGDYDFHFGLSLNLSMNYIANRVYLDDAGYDYKLPDYTLIDGKINQSFWKNFVLTFEVKNITDKNYQTEYGLPMPGRTFYGGMEVEF
ncbi:MAG TPA: TonB-dependent receptor [candidate division Zixibacteria bacterium]